MDNDRFNRADVRHSCPHCAVSSSGTALSCANSQCHIKAGKGPGHEQDMLFKRYPLQRKSCALQTLANWPPSVPGACKWWAHLQGTVLVIARDKPLPEEGSHSGKSMSGSQAHAHDSEDALVVREIDLQGCRHAGFSSHCLAPRLHAQHCSLLQAGYDIWILSRSWLRHEGSPSQSLKWTIGETGGILCSGLNAKNVQAGRLDRGASREVQMAAEGPAGAESPGSAGV